MNIKNDSREFHFQYSLVLFFKSFTFSQKPAYLFSNIRRLLSKRRQLFIKIRRLFSAFLIHCKSKPIKTTFKVY